MYFSSVVNNTKQGKGTCTDITIKSTGDNLNYLGNQKSGYYVEIPENGTLTIKANEGAGNIYHLYISFNANRSGKGGHFGPEHWNGGTKNFKQDTYKDDDGYGVLKKKHAGTTTVYRKRYYSDAYWYCSSDEGVRSVSFTGDSDDPVDILWIIVWYGDNSSSVSITGANSDSNNNFNTDANPITVSGNGSIACTYNDKGTAKTASGNSSASFSIQNSCWVTATATTSDQVNNLSIYDPESEKSSKAEDDEIINVNCKSATASKYFTQYWNVSTSGGQHTDGKYYATFYHNHNMIVPSGCSAWTYTRTTKNGLPYMTPSKEYSTTTVKVIPAYTAVIVCSTSPQSTLTFKNPVNNSASGAETDNNKCTDFTGNSEYSEKDVSASGYTNYYLMTDGDNGGLKFMRYNGKCPSHACYLHLSSSSPLAKGFVFSFPDETTGINVISADNSVSGDNAPMYNAAGQRVDSNYKGIVIQNGRKFIRR